MITRSQPALRESAGQREREEPAARSPPPLPWPRHCPRCRCEWLAWRRLCSVCCGCAESRNQRSSERLQPPLASFPCSVLRSCLHCRRSLCPSVVSCCPRLSPPVRSESEPDSEAVGSSLRASALSRRRASNERRGAWTKEDNTDARSRSGKGLGASGGQLEPSEADSETRRDRSGNSGHIDERTNPARPGSHRQQRGADDRLSFSGDPDHLTVDIAWSPCAP